MLNWQTEMVNSAQGIAGKAAVFKGIVQKTFEIFVINGTDEPMPNVKFKVTFEDGQTGNFQSDGNGVFRIPMKTGSPNIELLE